MLCKISKWGHSLALRIPAVAAKDLGFCEGMNVDVGVKDNFFYIKEHKPRKYKLQELLSMITEREELCLPHVPVGKEFL